MKATISELRNSSDKAIDNGDPVDVPVAMAVGDMLPQGDIGLLMIDSVPSGAAVEKWGSGDFQLAPGTSRGSRHTIPGRFRDSVKVYRVNDGDPLSDLVIEAKAPFDMEHPEHADHMGYPAGVYRVRHQQNAARERVRD